MTKLVGAVVALAVALSLVPSAFAGGPFTFSNRAAFERYVRTSVSYRGMRRDRAVIKSVGCAKAGIGRSVCAVTTLSPTKGLRTWAMFTTCPSDRSPVTACRFEWQPLG